MKSTETLIELIDDIEQLGDKLMLIVNIATSEHQLTERARRGFLEYGIDTINSFSAIETRIKIYRKSCAPS
ncbi:hypothetical protein HBO11_16470 [Pseudomonas sp. WS 5010]|uniref:hypothetical protein n=1 Tax=Pseudomonas sp. WS 5010 TaxID=2717489 RepID=UPI0014746DAA|nr:hypothetical protein [Pseudomonas sp. WS 5010]NMX87148.1 hypothetical protein [Pseudomonas sp. WS 5010]